MKTTVWSLKNNLGAKKKLINAAKGTIKQGGMILILFVLMYSLNACASLDTTRVRDLSYGPRPENPKKIVKEHFKYKLIDPNSAMYEINSVRKGYKYNPFTPNNLELAKWGWVIEGIINSKNRAGGYVGWKPFFAIYRRGNIVKSGFYKPGSTSAEPIFFP